MLWTHCSIGQQLRAASNLTSLAHRGQDRFRKLQAHHRVCIVTEVSQRLDELGPHVVAREEVVDSLQAFCGPYFDTTRVSTCSGQPRLLLCLRGSWTSVSGMSAR